MEKKNVINIANRKVNVCIITINGKTGKIIAVVKQTTARGRYISNLGKQIQYMSPISRMGS